MQNNYKIGTKMFYFVCRTLLEMFCFENIFPNFAKHMHFQIAEFGSLEKM